MKDSIEFGKAIVDVLKEFLQQTTLGAILASIAISLWLVFFYPSLPIVTYFAVFVTTWLVLNIIHDFYVNRIRPYVQRKRRNRYLDGKGGKKIMNSLSRGDKELVYEMFEDDAYSMFADYVDPKIKYLESKLIVARMSNMGPGGRFPYRLNPWVIDYLKKNPSYFDDIEID